MELLIRKQYEDINELINSPKSTAVAKTDLLPNMPVEYSTLPPTAVSKSFKFLNVKGADALHLSELVNQVNI